jgi:predicted membrane-bound mannosyltransferase/DNA-binding beta-propeller fold protein YncE
MQNTSLENRSWLDKPVSSFINLKIETLIFGILILFTILSRLYELGERVMSHDEINHVYFAWQFFQNGEYAHHPLSHGPLQFHLLSFFYFLFGDNDFSARLHAAVASIGTVIFLWKFRKYLGRTGTLVTTVLFLISPFMLFYGRYARNEALTTFFVLVSVWAILRYLDTGQNKYMFILAGAAALHFSTKETAFIFTAQLLIYLGILFIYRVSLKSWKISSFRQIFLILIILTFILIAVAGGFYLMDTPATTGEEITSIPVGVWISLIAAGVIFSAAFIILIVGVGWANLREERAFGLLLLQFTLIFPQLSAFPIFLAGWPIFDYHTPENVLRIAAVLVPMIAISVAGGILWKPREWLISAGIFYGIFIFLHSTVFTNITGIYTGLVGSLGYWLEQQSVERGSQPWYYFVLVQIPMYEYLAALGTLLAAGFGLKWLIRKPYGEIQTKDILVESHPGEELPKEVGKIHLVSLGLFGVITSVLAYMVAGEKMPWLSVHMVWPMLLVTGWAIGKLIDSIDWTTFKEKRIGLLVILFITLLVSSTGVVSTVIDPIKPFQGIEITELQATSNLVIAAIVTILCVGGIIYQIRTKNFMDLLRTGALIIFTLLGVLTIRTTILASYINYNQGTEYLVYAHGAQGPKDIYEQIEEISLRITGGKNIQIAYDNHSAYPFWWYLRNYPNQLQYGESPTRDVRDYPIILVGDSNYGKITPLVGESYIMTEYVRMVWPNQDYFNLDYLMTYLRNPETRSAMLNAIFKIWLSHDYESYGLVTGQDMSIQNWNPSNKMRMYVRKDIASQIWEFGSPIDAGDIVLDAFEDKEIKIQPAITINNINLDLPRGITTSKDGTIYVSDTNNDRVLHLTTSGEILHEWGFGGVFGNDQMMAEGYFNQPWGLTADENGYVYVADTWNHRIQKFSSEGEFITTWGYFNNQLTDPLGMWGPRDIIVDQNNYLLVSDTGNKRILIFNTEGEYINHFGEVGFHLGQFDEPVGLAISPVTGDLYVADTWNQRIQQFERSAAGQYTISLSWDIDGWYGQSLDNKPYIAVDQYDRIFVADPESARILVFSNTGEVIGYIGSSEIGFDSFGLVSGLAIDNKGGLWVTDSRKNRIQYFILPTP